LCVRKRYFLLLICATEEKLCSALNIQLCSAPNDVANPCDENECTQFSGANFYIGIFQESY